MRLLVLATLLAGCTLKPTPPVIESVQLPPTVTLGADNTYAVTLTISYHDDDDQIALLRLSVPTLSQTFDETITDAPLAGQVEATVRFPASTPKGAQEIDVSLIDASGLASVVAKQMVTLQ